MSVIDQPAAGEMSPSPRPDSGSSSILGSVLLGAGALAMVVMLVGLLALAFTALIHEGSSTDEVIVSDLDISLSEFAIDGVLSAPAGEVMAELGMTPAAVVEAAKGL